MVRVAGHGGRIVHAGVAVTAAAAVVDVVGVAGVDVAVAGFEGSFVEGSFGCSPLETEIGGNCTLVGLG